MESSWAQKHEGKGEERGGKTEQEPKKDLRDRLVEAKKRHQGKKVEVGHG